MVLRGLVSDVLGGADPVFAALGWGSAVGTTG